MYDRLADAELWLEHSVAALELRQIAPALAGMELAGALYLIVAGRVASESHLLVLLLVGSVLLAVGLRLHRRYWLTSLILVQFGGVPAVILALEVSLLLGVVATVVYCSGVFISFVR